MISRLSLPRLRVYEPALGVCLPWVLLDRMILRASDALQQLEALRSIMVRLAVLG
jgi:hypothetical protein